MGDELNNTFGQVSQTTVDYTNHWGYLLKGSQYNRELQRTHPDTLVNLEVRCVRGDSPDYLGAWINAHPKAWLRERLRYTAYYILHTHKRFDGEHR